jgi:hypothetical protein
MVAQGHTTPPSCNPCHIQNRNDPIAPPPEHGRPSSSVVRAAFLRTGGRVVGRSMSGVRVRVRERQHPVLCAASARVGGMRMPVSPSPPSPSRLMCAAAVCRHVRDAVNRRADVNVAVVMVVVVPAAAAAAALVLCCPCPNSPALRP